MPNLEEPGKNKNSRVSSKNEFLHGRNLKEDPLINEHLFSDQEKADEPVEGSREVIDALVKKTD